MVFRCFLLMALAASSWQPGIADAQEGVANRSQGLAPRKLAEGVMTVVPPSLNAGDTVAGTFDLDFVKNHPELEWTPPNFPEGKPFFASKAETLLELSKDITFRHYVWYLEFSFKPVRMIQFEAPRADGSVDTKVAWYMVYSVRYPGLDLQATADPESAIPTAPTEMRVKSVRFIPRFQIVSKERNLMLDSQILPVAKRAIEAKERVGKPLLDPVEISQQEIRFSESADDALWGVAIWTDVDPRLDFFAVDVRGLTNAYKIRQDSQGETLFDRKTLRIYHWRAGDAIDEYKDLIRLGIPAFEDPARLKHHLEQFNLQERLDYQWIYR